jgi:uncharacterized protein YciI
MWYVILCKDRSNSLSKRLEGRKAHRERLVSLQNEGRLLVAGPFPTSDSSEPGEDGFTGSMIVAEFNSIDDAVTWADKDPYVLTDVYEDIEVKPFIKVLP